MSFVAEQDTLAKRNQRFIGRFAGSHYGTGMTDQPDEMAYVCDIDCSDERFKVRGGCLKVGEEGWQGTIEGLFDLTHYTKKSMGLIQNGVMSVHLTADILAGHRQYYTWGQILEQFSWQELLFTQYWRDILSGKDV